MTDKILEPDEILKIALNDITEETRLEKEETEKENIITNTLLDLTLSGILEKIQSNTIESSEEDITQSSEIIYEVPEEQENISDTTTVPKNENTLSIDNNANALNINIVVAFCWWAVNYIVKSLVENICNYLKETPISQEQEEHQEEYTAPQFPLNFKEMKTNEPAAFEVIMIGQNINGIVEIGDMAYMVGAN